MYKGDKGSLSASMPTSIFDQELARGLGLSQWDSCKRH